MVISKGGEVKLRDATELAARQADDTQTIQAIVLLHQLSHNDLSYIPCEASAASGLKGKVIGEISPR